MIFYTALKDAEIVADRLQDKRYARIAYQNTDGTITASGSAVGYDAINVQTPATYNKWRSDSGTGGSIELDFGVAIVIDSISINSQVMAGAYRFEYWDGASWVVIDGEADLVLTTNDPLIYSFVELTTEKIRVAIAAGQAPEIINLYAGKLLVMQRAIYGGHTPVTLGRVTSKRPNVSAGGEFLGSRTIRKGVATTFSWENLKADWYRANFDQFALSARNIPFFIAWNSDLYPKELAYCWTNEDITPSNTGGGTDFMSVSMNVNGVDYGE